MAKARAWNLEKKIDITFLGEKLRRIASMDDAIRGEESLERALMHSIFRTMDEFSQKLHQTGSVLSGQKKSSTAPYLRLVKDST